MSSFVPAQVTSNSQPQKMPSQLLTEEASNIRMTRSKQKHHAMCGTSGVKDKGSVEEQANVPISCSAPTLIPEERDDARKRLWETFGLQPPPFPVGNPPVIKNEIKSNDTRAIGDLGASFVYGNVVSKERIEGRLQGCKSVYEMFGIPVPAWVTSGLEDTLNTEMGNVCKASDRVKGKGKKEA